MNEVYSSETPLLISRFNKPLVVVEPYKKKVGESDYLRFYGFMADAGGETGKDFVNRVRRSGIEKKYVEKLRNRNA